MFHFSFSSGSEPANDAVNIVEMGLGNWSKDPGSELTFQAWTGDALSQGKVNSWALPNQISFQEVAKQKEFPHNKAATCNKAVYVEMKLPLWQVSNQK